MRVLLIKRTRAIKYFRIPRGGVGSKGGFTKRHIRVVAGDAGPDAATDVSVRNRTRTRVRRHIGRTYVRELPNIIYVIPCTRGRARVRALSRRGGPPPGDTNPYAGPRTRGMRDGRALYNILCYTVKRVHYII